jgi:hypothetical protein
MEPYVMVRGIRDPGNPDVIVSEGVRLQLPPGMSHVELEPPRRGRRGGTPNTAELVAFCGYADEGDGVQLKNPDDPMAGSILLPGDPEELSRESERAARWAEAVSVVFVGLDVAVNLPLVFVVLSLVIR